MLNATLYDFQQEAVDRMVSRQQMLLAMTMGAGKTVTTIAAIEEFLALGDVGTALIVTPSMLKYQWQEEIHRFTDHRALVIDGPPKVREKLYAIAHKYYYVIVNYEAVVTDWALVKKLQFECLVIDEASYIKGFASKRTRATKALGKKVDIRFALTGQPVENRPEDVFSIMEFVDSDVLGRFDAFDRTFIVRDMWGRPKRYRNLPLLNTRLSEAMVRRTRADLKGLLPDVVEKMVPVKMSRAEAALYGEIRDRMLVRMSEVLSQFGAGFSLTANYGRDENHAMMRAQGEVMAMLLALRQSCDDANLIVESARKYQETHEDDPNANGAGSKFAAQLLEEGVLDNIPKSTKHAELQVLLKQALEDDPAAKIVVFSTFKGTLREIQARSAKYSDSVLFNGDMNAKQKNAAKLQFQRDPNTRLFLSSDAGGYGVNLSEANHLISFDLPWSTGKFEQRESRIIRLSTEFEYVTLIAMVVRGSVERRIYDMLAQKKGVAGAFIDGGYDQKGRYEITLSSLTEFLERNDV